MDRFRCSGVVLSAVDYGDSDRIVTFLTDDRGRLSAFARGARKSKRRFAGALEPFTLLTLQLAESRGSVHRLDGVEVLDGFGELRTDIGKVARAAYACELMRELCREQEPHPDLFALLVRFLQALAREGAASLALMRFELLALGMAGLMPTLEACGRCGDAATDDALFDPEHGGLVCPSCALRGAAAATPGAREAARALVRVQRARAGETLEFEPHVKAQARAMLSRFVAHHLGKRLKSLDFMRDVGVEA
ncbi:MAG: DNA repair protein RecO [Myxococcales bacterium]